MDEILEPLLLYASKDRRDAGVMLFYVHLIGMLMMPVAFVWFAMLRIPIFISYFPLYIYHLIEKKCPLTRIERRLHGEDRTVLDVFLSMLGFETNNENRNTLLIVLSTLWMLAMIYVISIMST